MQNSTNNGMSPKKRMLVGNLLILTATIFFGLNVPAMKILIPDWISPIGVTLCRYGGACILVWLTSLFLHTRKIDRSDWKIVIPSGVILFFFLFLFALSFRYASPIDISIILIFPPIIVVAINAIFRHSKIGWLEILGLLISFIGAVVLILAGHSGEKGSDSLLGDVLAFGSAVCYAVYIILIEPAAKKYDTISLMRWVLLAAGVCCLPFIGSLRYAPIVVHPTLYPILVIAFIILFPTYYAYLADAPAIKMIGAELVSMYQYLIPVIATIASVVMKLDKLIWYQPISMVIIMLGVVLANVSKHRMAKKLATKQTVD